MTIPQSCSSSSTCCCGVGNIEVYPVIDTGTLSTITMYGNMDGGQGCYGIQSMSADFNINDTVPTTAINTTSTPVGNISLQAVLSSTSTPYPMVCIYLYLYLHIDIDV